MLPTIAAGEGGAKPGAKPGSSKALEPTNTSSSSSFLSRVLGRSPSKGAAGTATSVSPRPDSSGVLAAQASAPSGSSLKGVAAAGGSNNSSNNWSIGSAKADLAARTPSKGSLRTATPSSAKTLSDAAASAGSPYMSKVAALLNTSTSSTSSNAAAAVVPRVPSAARLTPLAVAGGGSTGSASSPKAGAAPASPGPRAPAAAAAKQPVPASELKEEDLKGLSKDELIKLLGGLDKETKDLRQHLEVISGSGKPVPVPSTLAPASAAPRVSVQHPSAAPGAAGAVPGAIHRSPSLVVEFAEPRHQQRPSMIAQSIEQIRAGLGVGGVGAAPGANTKARESVAAAGLSSSGGRGGAGGGGGGSGLAPMEVEEEEGFLEDDAPAASAAQSDKRAPGPGPAGAAAAAAPCILSGPSLDPIQGMQAADAVKRQLMSEAAAAVAVAAAAEEEARKAAEHKKKAEAALAAAAVAAGAVPAKPKRRYKLLSVFPLLPPAMRREEWALSQFAIEKRLHKGYASEVYKARDLQSGEPLAVKVYTLSALGELNKVQLIREIRLHGAFAHRNIIELFVAFQDEHRVVLAQKYAEGGDLLRALHHAGGRLTEHSAVAMVIQPLLSCLVYLHSKGIIHRDIKPENILFDNGVLKVADFGLALNSNEEHAVTRAGTLHYMAPEVVKNPLKDHPDDFKNETRYHYNAVVDSWAVGCLAFELLAGFPPFSANTQQQVVQNINTMQVQFTKRMSEDAISFISAALEREPVNRATTAELIKHPWITQHMRRGSMRNITLQPQAGAAKVTTDFSPSAAKPTDPARRQADAGPRPARKEACMAPF